MDFGNFKPDDFSMDFLKNIGKVDPTSGKDPGVRGAAIELNDKLREDNAKLREDLAGILKALNDRTWAEKHYVIYGILMLIVGAVITKGIEVLFPKLMQVLHS
jgi:hypothetical protein